MTLAHDLSALADRLSAGASAAHRRILEATLSSLVEEGVVGEAVRVGEMIPDFELLDTVGRRFGLQDFLDRGPVVISFYLSGHCPYCSLALRALQGVKSDCEASSATVVAISSEGSTRAVATVADNALGYPVLIDEHGRVGRLFGLFYRAPAALAEVLRSFGIDADACGGCDGREMMMTATYVVDQQGTAVFAFVDPDPTRRAEPQEIVAAVKGLAAIA